MTKGLLFTPLSFIGFFLLFPSLLYGFILAQGYEICAGKDEKLSPFIFPLVSGAFFSFLLFFFKFTQGPLEMHIKGMLLFCFLSIVLLIWNWNQKLLFYPLWKLSLCLGGFLLFSTLLPLGFILGSSSLSVHLGFSFFFLVLLLCIYTLLVGLSFRPSRNPLGHAGDSLFWWVQFSF